jgi:hypothetical protein
MTVGFPVEISMDVKWCQPVQPVESPQRIHRHPADNLQYAGICRAGMAGNIYPPAAPPPRNNIVKKRTPGLMKAYCRCCRKKSSSIRILIKASINLLLLNSIK